MIRTVGDAPLIVGICGTEGLADPFEAGGRRLFVGDEMHVGGGRRGDRIVATGHGPKYE